MRGMERMNFCINKSYSTEQLELMLDKRYSYECKLYLRFTSSELCKDASVKLFSSRNLYNQHICDKVSYYLS